MTDYSNKPLIAVYNGLCKKDEKIILDNDFDYTRYNLLRLICFYINKNGGEAVVIPRDADINYIVKNIDGYLFPGGSDINPKFYNREQHIKTKVDNNQEDERFLLEETFLKDALNKGKPVLAICRGMQVANVILGRIWKEENPLCDLGDKGTLIQDIPEKFPDDDIHLDKNLLEILSQDVINWQNEVDKGNILNHPMKASHNVRILKDTKLYDLLGTEEIGCASGHHQGVGVDNLAPQLTINSYSVKKNGSVNYGIIDGAEYKNIILTQNHPEIGICNIANKLFGNLINNAKEYIKNNKDNRKIDVEALLPYIETGKFITSNNIKKK